MLADDQMRKSVHMYFKALCKELGWIGILCGIIVLVNILLMNIFTEHENSHIAIRIHFQYLATTIIILFGVLSKIRKNLDAGHMISYALSVISIILLFVYAIVGSADRSVTVNMLQTLEDRQPISSSSFKHFFVKDFICQRGALDKRIEEQQKAGLLNIDDQGQMRLSEFGSFINQTFLLIKRLHRFTDHKPFQSVECNTPPFSQSGSHLTPFNEPKLLWKK